MICRLRILLINGLQLPGNIVLLVVVCENLYKVLHTTKVYNSCGRKMSAFVIVCAWFFMGVWCIGFWLLELKDYEFACFEDMEQLSSIFIISTNFLLALCFAAMLILQLITTAFTVARYIILKHYFKVSNLNSLLPDPYLSRIREMADTLKITSQNNSVLNIDLKLMIITNVISRIDPKSDNRTELLAIAKQNMLDSLSPSRYNTNKSYAIKAIYMHFSQDQPSSAAKYLKNLCVLLESIESQNGCNEKLILMDLLSFINKIEEIVLEKENRYLVYRKSMKAAICLFGMVLIFHFPMLC